MGKNYVLKAREYKPYRIYWLRLLAQQPQNGRVPIHLAVFVSSEVRGGIEYYKWLLFGSRVELKDSEFDTDGMADIDYKGEKWKR